MSEEIKAIETLKNIVIQEYDWWINKGDYAESNVKEANDAIKTILNLIEKQQKEINKLKEQNKKYQRIEKGTTIIYKSKAKYVREDRIEKYYVNKNKIRNKIKELEKIKNTEVNIFSHDFFTLERTIKVLQELLGE